MTIGRIPKVDPGATQPQDRKPSRPLARRLQDGPVRQGSGAAQTVAARIRRRLQIDGRAAKPTTPASKSAADAAPSQPASLRILKRHPRLRKATLKDPRRHSGNSRLAHPPGRQDRRQSAKTIIRSNSRKRLRHNPRRKRREAGRNGQWLEPVPRNPNRTNSLPRPSPAGNSSTTTTQPSGRPKPAQPSTARAPDPGGSMPKLALANTELSRFAQAQDKWYQDGQVTLTSDIVKTVTADHVRLFPATRRQSNSSTSRSHRKRCWRCESCP